MFFFSGHLCEVVWRNHHPGHSIAPLLQLLSNIYDVNNEKIKINFDEENLFKSMDMTNSRICSIADDCVRLFFI